MEIIRTIVCVDYISSPEWMNVNNINVPGVDVELIESRIVGGKYFKLRITFEDDCTYHDMIYELDCDNGASHKRTEFITLSDISYILDVTADGLTGNYSFAIIEKQIRENKLAS